MDGKMIDAINTRCQRSQERYGLRNVHFGELFDAYDGKIWMETAKEHERRVTVRLVADTVEMDTAILVSRPPIITVPPSNVSGITADLASKLENALIGAWNMMEFHTILHEAVRFASLTGWGAIRGPILVKGREPFPLVAMAADPRMCYPGFTANKDLLWNFYSMWRTAGDIRGDIPKGAQNVRGVWHADALPEDDDILMNWTEYWGWHGEDLIHAIFVNQKAGQGQIVGTPPPELPKQGIGSSGVWSSPGLGTILKSPSPMQKWYGDIPFVYFFPRPNARVEVGYEGDGVADRILELQKALSMLATVLATDAFMRGNTPMWGDGTLIWPTDDQGVGYVNTRPGGYTQFSPGTRLEPLPGSLDAALVERLYNTLEDLAGRSSFPRTMFGQYEAALSGIAMDVLNNPVLIKEALAQRRLERALEKFNSRLIQMFRHLSPNTEVFGRDKRGAMFQLSKADLPKADYTYNVVQLSASLPKDIPAMVASMVQVAQVKGVSRRTLMEYVQNAIDLPNKDPEWEFERMAEEDVQLATQNIDTMAAAAVHQAMVQAGMQPLLQQIQGQMQGAQAAPQTPDVPGLPPQAMAPQALGMGAGLEEGLGMQRRVQPGGLVPGAATGAMGAV